MNDVRLVHDVAWTATQELVGLIRWERDEDRVEAFNVFLPVVKAAIEKFQVLKERELRRLAKNLKNVSEN